MRYWHYHIAINQLAHTTSIQTCYMHPTGFLLHRSVRCQNLSLGRHILQLNWGPDIILIHVFYYSSTSISQFSLSLISMASLYFVTCNSFVLCKLSTITDPPHANSSLFISPTTACYLNYFPITAVPIIHKNKFSQHESGPFLLVTAFLSCDIPLLTVYASQAC